MYKEGITILNKNSQNTDFAVLELSTKAVKLLIGPQKDLVMQGSFKYRDHNDDFDFQKFYRTAEKPEAGKGLNSEMIMDMDYFNRNVIPSIKKMMRNISDKGINKVVCVATAAYRNAENQDEILNSIKNSCGINVKVLNKVEEAEATYFAFINSKHEWIDTNESQILIDQGGGSTEVTFFQNNKMIQTHSLGFGTTDLLKELFNNIPNDSETLEEGFDRCKLYTHTHLRDMYLEANKDKLFDTDFDLCVAVGTAITKATGIIGNARQHCFEMSVDFIKDQLAQAEFEISKPDVKTTLELKNIHNKLNDRYEKDALLQTWLTMRLGLPMVLELLEKFSLKNLMVSGTGLWYGIYFQEINNS
jgi:exopolyphosphatase/pppGpp-phosphohydrolase